MHRLPLAAPSSSLPSASTICGTTPKNGCVAEPGLSRVAPGSGVMQNAAGLGLPPGVDDRAAVLADHVVVPFPGFRIDRLADGAEQFQALARGLLHRPVARLHQRADRGRGGVEGVDLVLVADLPEPRHGRVVRHALEHQGGGAVRQRPVHDVAVAGDPADVGGAPVDLAVVVVEDVLVRHRHVDVVAAGGVQHALRLAGRARRIEDEQRILGVHVLARALGGHHLGGLVVVDVAHRIHLDRGAGAAHHDDVVDAAGLGDGGVGVGLERDLAAAADALVGGDHHLGAAVLDAAGQRVG